MLRNHFAKFVFSAIVMTAIIAVSCNRTGISDSSGPPEVLSTSPVNDAEEVALDETLTATFSEEMDTTTFNTTSFNLKLDSSPIPGIVTFTGNTATFIPLNNLLPDRIYVATITTDVTDAMGFKMPENYVWRFSTIGTNPDTLNFEVLSVNPSGGSVNVSLSPTIIANFSEAINPSTLNTETFTLRQGTNPIPGSVMTGDSSAAFSPGEDLNYGNTYTATITTGAESVDGNRLAANYSWNFTTAENPDDEPPEVRSTDPEEDADDVAADATVSVTFSEEINPSTLNATTFSVRRESEAIEGSIEYSGTTATFIPDEDLEFDETYAASVTDDVEDITGNNLQEDFEWEFRTEDEPDDDFPFILETDPEDDADDVKVDISVSVEFSEVMNPFTINTSTFLLRRDGPGNSTRSVFGLVSYSGFTATFTPIGDLDDGERYMAIITSEVEDRAGNEMREDFEWEFRTERDRDDDDDDD